MFIPTVGDEEHAAADNLKKATADSKAAQLLGQLLGYLRGLPDSTDKISSRKAKDALGLTKDKATELAFTRAVGLLDLADHGWQLDGRSLGRSSAILGFVDQT